MTTEPQPPGTGESARIPSQAAALAGCVLLWFAYSIRNDPVEGVWMGGIAIAASAVTGLIALNSFKYEVADEVIRALKDDREP